MKSDKASKKDSIDDELESSLVQCYGNSAFSRAKREALRKLEASRKQEAYDESDILWTSANTLLQSSIDRDDQDSMASAYWFMARFLHGKGQEHNYVQALSARARLNAIQKEGFVKEVEILTASDSSCPVCRELNGKTIPLKEALKQELLPCKGCTFRDPGSTKPGWCRCIYIPSI